MDERERSNPVLIGRLDDDTEKDAVAPLSAQGVRMWQRASEDTYPLVVPRDQRYGRYESAAACDPRRERKKSATFRRPGSLSTSEESSPCLSVNKLQVVVF